VSASAFCMNMGSRILALGRYGEVSKWAVIDDQIMGRGVGPNGIINCSQTAVSSYSFIL
jgi:hypothetical protein